MKEIKKTNPLVFVGIGCLVLIVLISIGTFFVGKFFASKIAGGMLGNAIESKTGIKTSVEDLENGKMTFTDKETGATVNVGGGSVPDNFPSDMPLYPEAKVTSSLASGQKADGSGFWLTLTSQDDLEKIASFYKTTLIEKGWVITGTYASDGNQTQAVKKGNLSGTVTVTREKDAKETQIVIILSEEAK